MQRQWLPLIYFLFLIVITVGCTIQEESAGKLRDVIVTPIGTAVGVKSPEPVEEPGQPASAPVESPTPSQQAVEPTVSFEEESRGEVEPGKPDADVLFVSARRESDDLWHFTVTVTHPDTGWEDYADGWDVVLPNGTVASPDPDSEFTRLLLHPHENEQPFTRSQGGIAIPETVNTIVVRAHDIVDGFGGREVIVDLTKSSGADFEVQR